MSKRSDERITLFVARLIVDWNGVEACRAAGYKGNEAVLAVQAHRLMKDERTKKALKKALSERVKRTRVSADKVVRELARVAFSDLVDAFDENGRLKDMGKIPQRLRRAIAGVEVFEEYQGSGANREFIGYTKKLKLWDKTKALESLAKHTGALKEPDEGGGDEQDKPEVHIYLPDNGRKTNN